MKRRVLSILLVCAMMITMLPQGVSAADNAGSITEGKTYYFDLSGEDIPGTKNDKLPDTALNWVPFTYVGEVNAYVLNSKSSGEENSSQAASGAADSNAEYGYTYAHRMFIAEYNITHTMSWNELNEKNLIFGKTYGSNGADYTLRAPSAGSAGNDTAFKGIPENNEWDTIHNKNKYNSYIKNWSGIFSWAQDTTEITDAMRVCRGNGSAINWSSATLGNSNGFRPVLEIREDDALKTVEIDLNGGKIGGSISGSVNIAVKSGENFTAPAGEGLTRPEGNSGTYFSWLGDNERIYAPGAAVPEDVTKLTAQWTEPSLSDEQFHLTVNQTYYFDLSGEVIPGTKNDKLPDTALHWVPFSYAGTVNAYVLDKNENSSTYNHSLFIADRVVTHTVSWNELNEKNLIFGKTYGSNGVSYTLRAPSAGSSGNETYSKGIPENNEWDAVYNKNANNKYYYINKWMEISSWGQDRAGNIGNDYRVYRGGSSSATYWYFNLYTVQYNIVGFRPVLEIQNTDMLSPTSLKAVAINLNGGKIGTTAGTVNIAVKSGQSFTAPKSEGLTRPEGNSGGYFKWLGSDGRLYEPDSSVPADVTSLTALWTDTYNVMLNTNGGAVADGKNITEYKYGTGVVLPKTGEITKAGYAFKGWYTDENFSGSPATEISSTDIGDKVFYAKWESLQYTITYSPDDDTIEKDTYTDSIQGEAATIYDKKYTRTGYTQSGWKTVDGKVYEFGGSYTAGESVTLYPAWQEKSGYTVEFDTAGGSAVDDKVNVKWTDKVLDSISVPVRNGYEFKGWKCGDADVTAETAYGELAVTDDVLSVTLTAKWKDIEPPTGEVAIDGIISWSGFDGDRPLNSEYDRYFKDAQTVRITSSDNSGSPVLCGYIISRVPVEKSELDKVLFASYEMPFEIEAEGEYFIYVQLADASLNVSYINSSKIVIDNTPPVISGIENGKTYCEAKAVTVTEEHLHGIAVNNSIVRPDENSRFVLNPAEGKQTITVYDKAGNTSEMTVTVNDGHTYEWQNENGQYWKKCRFCDDETAKQDIPVISINGADAVYKGSDYTFSFTLPESCIEPAAEYEYAGAGNSIALTSDNREYTGAVPASAYADGNGSIKLTVSAKTADGYEFTQTKTVTVRIYSAAPADEDVITVKDGVTSKVITKTTVKNTKTETVKNEQGEDISTVTAKVSEKVADKLADEAVSNKSDNVEITVKSNDGNKADGEKQTEIEIPKKAIDSIVKNTDADLVIKTDNGQIAIDSKALGTIAAAADGETLRIVVTANSQLKEAQKPASGAIGNTGVIFEVAAYIGNTRIYDLKDGKAEILLPVPENLKGKDIAIIYINDKGICEIVNHTVATVGTDNFVRFTTSQFANYAIVEKADAEKIIEQQNANKIKNLIKEVKLKATTSKTSKKNIEVKIGEVKNLNSLIKEAKAMGYTVKYKFYRSTKKASKYKAVKTKDTDTYINTVGKKGTKYYYKARVLVYDGKTLIAQTELKQCRYGVRSWSR